MPGAEQTYTQLLDFGIDPILAREASRRHDDRVEAAVEWCFGAGASWKPEPVSDPPKYTNNGTQHLEHREVSEDMDFATIAANLSHPPAPPLPPRRSPQPPARPVIGSNNPFYAAANPDPNTRDNSPLPTDDAFDEELQRAIRLSEEGGSGDTTMGGERDERERSVRATAPPPSPNSKPDAARLQEVDDIKDEGDVLGTLFGPSTKEEEGATALMSLSSGENKPSKEDEDLNRAIQDSLMTASFHSASAVNHVEKPTTISRQEGAPLVFLSESGDSTYAAHFLQAIYAIPQVRDIILHFATADGTDGAVPAAASKADINSLARLFQAAQSYPESFVEMDDVIGKVRPSFYGSQLPPKDPMKLLLDTFGKLVEGAVLSATGADPELSKRGALWANPILVTRSTVSPTTNPPQFVEIARKNSMPYRICPNLADILWRYDRQSQSIVEIGEMLTVFLEWDFGAERKVWDLEERIVLDRFMTDNQAWSTQIRAQEGVAKGNHRRIKEKMEQLTNFQGNNFQESLSAIIKHYEATSADHDGIDAQMQTELKAKLSTTLEILKAKTEALNEDLKREEEIANGALFDTDEPEHNQHIYSLRAVLMHDGAIVPGKHLYMYVLSEDNKWWKIVDHEVSESDWETIKKDQTGIYMGGGPHTLIYARESPRPPKRVPEPSAETPKEVDITMRGDSADLLAQILSSLPSQPSTLVPGSTATSAPSQVAESAVASAGPSGPDGPDSPAPAATAEDSDLLGPRPESATPESTTLPSATPYSATEPPATSLLAQSQPANPSDDLSPTIPLRPA